VLNAAVQGPESSSVNVSNVQMKEQDDNDLAVVYFPLFLFVLPSSGVLRCIFDVPDLISILCQGDWIGFLSKAEVFRAIRPSLLTYAQSDGLSVQPSAILII
jgi:hypothetical protein